MTGARIGDGLVRRRAVVDGRVQAVGFRWATEAEARRLGLAGFVRNLPDGSVEVEAEGQEAAVADLVAWLHSGPPSAVVRKVEVVEISPIGESGFRTTY